MNYQYYTGAPTQSFPIYGHGLPTPEQSQAQVDDLPDTFSPLNAYSHNYNAAFGTQFHIGGDHPPTTAGFVAAPHSPPESYSKQSVSSNDQLPMTTTHGGGGQLSSSADGAGSGDDLMADGNQAVRSSSEEKDGATPAQSRRKAQNRAAQRAFRERKERHVRDLEQKVNNLEQESTTLVADNDRLKRELAKFATENEILRATSATLSSNATGANGNGTVHGSGGLRPEPTTTGPLHYTPTDFYSSLASEGHNIANPMHRINVCPSTGEKLYGAGATWDFIQSHELYKRGLVNIADVCERLKGLAQCDGQGPAFRESIIRRAIEESATSGSDELI